MQRDVARRQLLRSNANHHLALVGELDGVADQVGHHLPQPARVAHEPVRHVGRDVAGELEALLVGLQRVRPERVAEGVPEAEGDALQIEPPRLDLREVQDVVQEREQRPGRELDGLEALALLAVELRLERDVRHADDGVHRGADLVAHVGQELRLEARGLERLVARLGQFGLGPLAFDGEAAELRGAFDERDLVVRG